MEQQATRKNRGYNTHKPYTPEQTRSYEFKQQFERRKKPVLMFEETMQYDEDRHPDKYLGFK